MVLLCPPTRRLRASWVELVHVCPQMALVDLAHPGARQGVDERVSIGKRPLWQVPGEGCVSVRCGWCSITVTSTGRSGKRSARSPRSWDPRPRPSALWVRQAQRDTGRRPGATTQELSELKRLKRENAELRRANDILKRPPISSGRAPPPVDEVIRFIDEHQDRRSGQLRWDRPIAQVLGIAPSTYHAAEASAVREAVRDAELRPQILRVWEQNLAVYAPTRCGTASTRGRRPCRSLHRRAADG